jgi:acetyltransferase-like isoleucine patch superfamily enzyme
METCRSRWTKKVRFNDIIIFSPKPISSIMKKSPPKLLDVFFTFYSTVIYFEVVIITTTDIFLMGKVLLLFGVIFFQSPFIWRILSWLYGPTPTMSYLGRRAERGNLWYLGHKLQEVYETFDFLENFLKSIPGAYSAWLRLWGAEIGKKVNWTSGCKLVDRPYIHIGDRSLIGNMSYISAHAIKKKDGRYVLLVKGVEIKEDVVVSYSVTISPGVILEANTFIESGAVVYPNKIVKQGQKYERFEELFDERFNFLFKRN